MTVMPRLFNLARVRTTTTGTGTMTLGGAVSGFLSFAQAGVQSGDVVAYAIRDGANSEIGYGTYTSATATLTRNVRKSTNSDAAISLSGNAEVLVTPSAEVLEFLQAGTGAVSRTLQSKMRERVSLEDFGVVSGLTVSDAVAEANATNAQKALDALESTGGVVYGFAQYYVFKAAGLRFPANVFFEGAGHGTWRPSLPLADKTWGGTNLIFKGTGPQNVTITGVTSMAEAGGWREDPDTGARFFKLLSLMNDDATGSTPATPRALSVAVAKKGTHGEPWGVSRCRIVPWIGVDGIATYSLTSGTSLGDNWDIGLLIEDTEQGRFEDVQIRGYWRAHGCLMVSPGLLLEGASEGNILRKVSAQGYNGLSLRSGDIWEVQATTTTTLEILWTNESYWPASGGFEGLQNGTDYTYTSLTRNGDNLVFNGVSSDPTGTTQIRNPLRGTGFSTTLLDSCEGWALWHHSGDIAEDLGFDDPSKGGEFSGFPLRGVHAMNSNWFGEDAASPCVFMHDFDDAIFLGGKFEIGHVIASPFETNSTADAPAGSTINLRLVDTCFSTSVDTRLFTPRSVHAPWLQINPFDESDGDFYFKALSGQDTQFELATAKQFQILNDDETVLLRLLEATGRLGIGTTADPTRKLDVQESDSSTATALPVARLIRESTGTPANGIGASQEFVVETAAANNEIGMLLEAVCADVTPASEDFDLIVKLMAAGAAAAERFRVNAAGQLILRDGSAAAPAVTFATGGLAAGWYAEALNTLALATNGIRRLGVSAGGNFGVGLAGDATVRLAVRSLDASTDTAATIARITRESSGTPANGIGVSFDFEVETAAGHNEIGAALDAICTDVTDTSEDFDFVFRLMAAGAAAAEKARFKANGAFVPGDARLTAQNTLTWYPVGRSGAALSRVSANVAGDATETVIATVTIPANAPGPNGIVRVSAQWRFEGGTENKTVRWRLGGISGTIYYSSGTVSTQLSARDLRDIRNVNSASVQAGGSVEGFGLSASDIIPSAIDTTSAVDLVFTTAWAGATSGETITLQSYLVEILYGA